jgi:acyl dehydratase
MTPDENELFNTYKARIGQEILPMRERRLHRPTGYDDNVTWEGIKRWAIVTEDYNGLWFDQEYTNKSRWQGIIAPPLFLLAIEDGVGPPASLVTDVYSQDGTLNKEKYSNFIGGLHASNDWEFFEPVRPGDVLTSSAKCSDIFWKKGEKYRLLFTFGETTYTNQKGELVAKNRTGSVYRFK